MALMNWKTLMKSCFIVAALTVGTPLWTEHAHVYTVYNQSNTWNEAHEICHTNNNSLLSMEDEVNWMLWQILLDPTEELPRRSIQRFWFGLHAPDQSNMSALFWDDCSKAQYIEWETTCPRPTYTVNHPCLAFDVYFKPFTTVLLKLWIAEQCNKRQNFVCSYDPDVSGCISHGCDEMVYLITDQNVCSSLTAKLPGSDYRVVNVSSHFFCHLYQHEDQYTDVYYTICYLPDVNMNLSYCSPEINWVSTYTTDESLAADDRCKALEVTSTDTVESTPDTSTTGLCECPCEAEKGTISDLTLQQKIEKTKKELTINKKNTSLHKRRFISVQDNRASAAGIGSLGVAILVLVMGSIVLMDISALKNDMFNIMHNIRFLYGKSKVVHGKKDEGDIPNNPAIFQNDGRSFGNNSDNKHKTDIRMRGISGDREGGYSPRGTRLQRRNSASKISPSLQKISDNTRAGDKIKLIRHRGIEDEFSDDNSELKNSFRGNRGKIQQYRRSRNNGCTSKRVQPNVKVIKCFSEDSDIRWMKMF